MYTKQTDLVYDAALIPSKVSMSENTKTRSITLPLAVWSALDEDAERCKRSSLKQIEALLSAYYGLGRSEIDVDRLQDMAISRYREEAAAADPPMHLYDLLRERQQFELLEHLLNREKDAKLEKSKKL